VSGRTPAAGLALKNWLRDHRDADFFIEAMAQTSRGLRIVPAIRLIPHGIAGTGCAAIRADNQPCAQDFAGGFCEGSG